MGESMQDETTKQATVWNPPRLMKYRIDRVVPRTVGYPAMPLGKGNAPPVEYPYGAQTTGCPTPAIESADSTV